MKFNSRQNFLLLNFCHTCTCLYNCVTIMAANELCYHRLPRVQDCVDCNTGRRVRVQKRSK